jgi:O-antigen/teichoic acid export membrane protein
MQAPELASALRLASILLLLNAVGGVQNGVLLGLEAFKPFSLLLGAEGLLTLIGIGAGSALGGLDGAVLGSALGPLLVALPRHRIMRAECARLGIPLPCRGTAAELPLLWSAVLPAVLIGVSAQPFEWLGRVLLARRPDGYAAVGVFTAAYAWSQLVAFAATQLTTPAMPVMANVLATGDRRAFRRLLGVLGLATLGVTIVTVVPVIVLSGVIMRAYGADFSPGGTVLAILAAAYGVSALSTLFRAVLVSTGRFWTQNLHVVIWGTVLVTGVFLFDRFDALGLALAYLMAFAVVVVTQGIAAWRALGAHRPAGATA